MTHPLARLAPGTERKLFIGTAAASVVLMGLLGYSDSHNITNVTPYGIVSFQLAGKPLMSDLILEKWRALPDGMFWVSFGLYADYAFMVAYATVLALVSLRLGKKLALRDPNNGRIATFVAWLVTFAAPFDAVENFAHLMMVNGASSATYTPVAFACALAKFACLGAFAMFGLVSCIMLLATKPKVAAA